MNQETRSAQQQEEQNYSPLYGSKGTRRMRSKDVDVAILGEDEVLLALENALSIYMKEMAKKQYSVLTMNSYGSAVNRFITFLRDGELIVDTDRKPPKDDFLHKGIEEV